MYHDTLEMINDYFFLSTGHIFIGGLTWRIEPLKIDILLFCLSIVFKVGVTVGLRVRIGFRVRVRLRIKVSSVCNIYKNSCRPKKKKDSQFWGDLFSITAY